MPPLTDTPPCARSAQLPLLDNNITITRKIQAPHIAYGFLSAEGCISALEVLTVFFVCIRLLAADGEGVLQSKRLHSLLSFVKHAHYQNKPAHARQVKAC